MNNKFYITTTLPYVNDIPHIGHTLEFIQADVVARFFRNKLGEENVWLNVGTDEHGQKILQKAEEKDKPVQKFVDDNVASWKDFCEKFQISYNTFYRTSDAKHHKQAQEFWKKSLANGDIYTKEYTGLYCVGCEEFKTEKELVDGKCPLHNTVPEKVSEENYFFKLSKYRQHLLDWLKKKPEVMKPTERIGELKNWIANMEDISISRKREKLSWGIEVPDDTDQTIYVWFDALTNYINVLGYGNEGDKSAYRDNEKYSDWWPGVQIFGSDNLCFQGAIWQGMLASVGEPQTSKLLRHGFILAEDGTKMSKTKGNVVSPFDQFEKYGVEALRYYLIAGISTYDDAPFSELDLVSTYNSHLANNFGNLLNRVLHLSNSKNAVINNESGVEIEFKQKVDEINNEVEGLFSDFELQKAVLKINDLNSFGNEYITEKAPWNKELSSEEVEIILNNLSYLLSTSSKLLIPVIPTSAQTALENLEKKTTGVLFEKLEVK